MATIFELTLRFYIIIQRANILPGAVRAGGSGPDTDESFMAVEPTPSQGQHQELSSMPDVEEGTTLPLAAEVADPEADREKLRDEVVKELMKQNPEWLGAKPHHQQPEAVVSATAEALNQESDHSKREGAESPQPCLSTKMKIGIGLLLVIIVAAAVVIALTAGGVGGSDADTRNIERSGGIDEDDDSGTSKPTPSPTTFKSGLFDLAVSFSGEAVLMDDSSPQHKALDWVSSNISPGEQVQYDDETLLQRYSLATIYYATNGLQWTTNDYLLPTSFCLWEGVTCGQPRSEGATTRTAVDDDAIALDLSSFNLAGSLPKEIGLLSSLTSLNLSGNSMTGLIPEEISGLTALTSLTLQDNTLDGEIPVEALARLANLQVLRLEGNNLEGNVPPFFCSSVSAIQALSADCLDDQETGAAAEVSCNCCTSCCDRNDLCLAEGATYSPTTARPTANPTQSPTTLAPTSLANTVFERMFNFASDLSRAELLADTSTAQYRAVSWLTDDEVAHQMNWQGTELVQRYVLAVFFYSLNGENWNQNPNFFGSSSVCDWSGPEQLQCNDSGDLTDLAFSQYGATGTLPEELQHLTSLEYLALTSNAVGGTIPAMLGELTALTVLALGGNELDGTIPSEFSSLTRLEALYLWNNNFISTIPSSLGDLIRLKHLELSGNDLEETIPSSLGGLPELINLYLHGNVLSGRVPIIGFSRKLEELNLDDNVLTGPFPPIFLAGSPLKSLRMVNNMLSGSLPTDIEKLNNLEKLVLYGNDFTGLLPTSIGMMTSLTALGCDSNSFRGSLPSEFGLLTDLNELYFYSNLLSGSLPSEIGSLTALTATYLSRNNLTGILPTTLGSLTSLVNMQLDANSFSGTLPSELGLLTGLTLLSLNVNSFTGSIPDALTSLTNLDSLYLEGNSFTGTVPVDFCSAPFSFRQNSVGSQLRSDCLDDVECDCCVFCGNNEGNILYCAGFPLCYSMEDYTTSIDCAVVNLDQATC